MWNRKVQKSGGSYFVTMPKPWARNTGVSRGDEVYLNVCRHGCLTISADEESPRKTEIRLWNFATKSSISSLLSAGYLSGYNQIRCHTPNASCREALRAAVRESSVYQVLLQTEGYTDLYSTARNSEIAVKRLFKNILDQIEVMIVNLSNEDLMEGDDLLAYSEHAMEAVEANFWIFQTESCVGQPGLLSWEVVYICRRLGANLLALSRVLVGLRAQLTDSELERLRKLSKLFMDYFFSLIKFWEHGESACDTQIERIIEGSQKIEYFFDQMAEGCDLSAPPIPVVLRWKTINELLKDLQVFLFRMVFY